MVMFTCYCCNLFFCLEFVVHEGYLRTKNNSILGLWWHSVIECFPSDKQGKTSQKGSNLLNNDQRTEQKWPSIEIWGLREIWMQKERKRASYWNNYTLHRACGKNKEKWYHAQGRASKVASCMQYNLLRMRWTFFQGNFWCVLIRFDSYKNPDFGLFF